MAASRRDVDMRYWFLNASSTQCEVMTAIQLDYRFEVNNFDSMWLIHAKNIGFTKINQVQYELPSDVVRKSLRKSAEHESSKELYNVQHICNKLNALAIPQGKSVFDRIGCINDGINIINEKDIDRWANIREELIFRKFYGDIEKEYCKLKKSKTKDGKDKTLLHRRQSSTTSSKYPNSRRKELKRSKNDSIVDGPTREKRKLWESSDAGVEFYFQKGRGNKKSLRTKNGSDVIYSSSNNALTSSETAIDYPSLQVYEESARLHRLSTIASTKEENLVGSFEDWKFLISTNHSLLFYGVGSKKNILHRFAHQNLDGDICEIDGFDHDVTVDGILQLLTDRWLGGQELSVRKKNIFHVHYEKSNRTNTRSVTTDNFRIPPFFPYQDDIYIIQKAVMVAKNIAKEVMRTSRPVTLIIHNIDGISLCDNRSQEVLAALVSQSRTDCGLNAIRLIASVDHINGQEVFMNSNFRHRLHWLWKEVHTLRPYIAEVLQEQAVLENYQCFNGGLKAVRAEGKRNIEYHDDDDLNQHESIFSVLKSLASTHAESLRQLAWLHLNTKKEWVSYIDILQRCRSERIVQADHQLRLYLGELLDHNILERNNNSTSSTTSYRIPHSDKILNLIWEFTVN